MISSCLMTPLCAPTVWLARRSDEQFDQQVAVKLLRPGMATDSAIERFFRERQTLANLNHPHIARLLDGGSTEDGTPFLVMEYIEGQPIDDFCKQHDLALQDRLRLFRKVCSAVQYAHQIRLGVFRRVC